MFGNVSPVSIQYKNRSVGTNTIVKKKSQVKEDTSCFSCAQYTYPTGRGIENEPENSPGPRIIKFDPKIILHSLRNDTVQKGRTKSWLSIWGGIQSPSSYMLTMQLSGIQVGGSTCHFTSLLMITLKRGGRGSTVSLQRMPGGFPFLSCQQKSKTLERKDV